MKNSSKTIVSSICTLIAGVSVVSGATYALFTSESKVNVAVTSANVSLVANFDESSMVTHSFDWVDPTGASFYNGGSAIWDSNTGTLALNMMTPGDGVDFKINVVNESNIKVLYRFSLSIVADENVPGSDALADALVSKATIEGTEYSFKDGKTTAWKELNPENQKFVVPVSVEFPDGQNQNHLQGKAVSLCFKVEAIQGNGKWEDAYVYTDEEFKNAFEAGGKIVLMNDINVESDVFSNGNVTIDFNGYSITNINATTTLPRYGANAGKRLVLENIETPFIAAGEGTVGLANAKIGVNTSALSMTSNDVHALTIESGFTGNIELIGSNVLMGGKNCNGIYVPANTTLDLSGDELIATGNNGIEYMAGASQYSTTDNAEYALTGGTAIGGEGNIYIHDVKSLTAKGFGLHGYGIGGDSKSIVINNSTIKTARGGFVNQTDTYIDPKYNKKEPEGGAAIGSNFEGAKIEISKCTIEEAIGGSKAAGIGADFWTAIDIEITDSLINKVVGGASAAGIGGSRVRQNDSKTQNININIVNSDITAFGGYFGAGIGSGYDTHCHKPEEQGITTINISGTSIITAIGGKYAAGVGGGYHNGGLAGTITSDVTINAQSGEKFYKAEYTLAQDIGFGVCDPNRDGLNNTCTLTYGGTVISFPEAANSSN